MNRWAVLLSILIFSLVPADAGAVDADGYIKEARGLANGGDIAGAVTLLEKGSAEHPDDPDLLAYLGLYTGMSAGRTQNYEEAARLVMLSFERLDAAVAMDGENPEARLCRGIICVNVPIFFGKLDTGISDLEKAAELYSASSSPSSVEGLAASLTNLAQGYEKKGDPARQRKALQGIIAAAPGTEAAGAAAERLKGIAETAGKAGTDTALFEPAEGDSEKVLALKASLAADDSDTALLLQLGETYYNEEKYAQARKVLDAYTAVDQTNASAYKMLATSISMIAQHGYDEKIHEDTDYMSGIAFDVMAALDKAVGLSPDDMELRLTRGIFGLLLPFFLQKHGQSVADLEMVAAGDVADDMRSQALFYLGYAKEREALTSYIELARKYPGTEGARLAFQRMKPDVDRIDESALEKPYVKIDFILGFQDQLPPQTAVWIEDGNENHIRTLYVSGFAGYVKEKQVTLPLWAAVSKFEGIDGVTSASIDIGHHIYIWDLKDYNGRKVAGGRYRVRVETSHWPSNLYQNVETFIEVGKKANSVRVEEGDFIPFLEVSYIK